MKTIVICLSVLLVACTTQQTLETTATQSRVMDNGLGKISVDSASHIVGPPIPEASSQPEPPKHQFNKYKWVRRALITAIIIAFVVSYQNGKSHGKHSGPGGSGNGKCTVWWGGDSLSPPDGWSIFPAPIGSPTEQMICPFGS